MYKSKEVRWFFKKNNKSIEEWFATKEKTFNETKSRTDFYLPVPGKNDISVKIREGNVEIKQRHGKPKQGQLAKQVKGYFEDWTKWSFDVEDKDKLARDITKKGRFNWIKVDKVRIGVKVKLREDGSLSFHDISYRKLPFGCQIEYTRIKVKGSRWYTFGLEWFGDKHFKVPQSLLNEILNDVKLNIKDSAGYNEFLNKLQTD